MTNKQIIEVIQAAEKGKQIEVRIKGFTVWIVVDVPEENWDFQKYEYRVARGPREFSLVKWPGETCIRGSVIDGEVGWHVCNGLHTPDEANPKIIRVREILG